VEDDAREVPAGGGQGRGTELAVYGAQISHLRLEEHAPAVRLYAEHRRGPLGQRSTVREELSFLLSEMEADVLVRAPLNRDRPARRAAGARVLAEVVSMQAETVGASSARFVFHFENSDYRKRPSDTGQFAETA
jgi:hypothetical protein